MRLRRALREAVLATVAALVAILTFGPLGDDTGPLHGLEAASLDLRFRLRGPEVPRGDIAVVLVDDATLARYGRWPLDRRLYAKALDALTTAGAKVVAFDILFSEPDKRDGADPDAEFSAAIKRSGRVLLAAAASRLPGAEPDLSDYAFQRFDPSPVQPEDRLRAQSMLAPIPPLLEAAAGIGLVNTAADADGVPRGFYLALPCEGDYLPALGIRAAAMALGIPWPSVGLAPGEAVHLGTRTVPTDQAMRLLVRHYGPAGTFPTYSFADLLDGRIDPARFRDRIVIVGGSFIGNADANVSPFGATPLPGSERQATILANILDGRFLQRPPLREWVLAAPVLGLAFLAGLLMALLPTRAVSLTVSAPLVIWFAVAQAAFAYGWWLPLAVPELALGMAAGSALAFRYWVSDRDRRRVKSAFGRYLAPSMVEILAGQPERLKLGGETRRMTLLFCDIRGFTTVSEAYRDDPQGLTRLINRFLTPMTGVILEARGTIDKYMGDCIMAFWNAPLDDPDHAAHACAAALRMRAALAELNGELDRPIAIGIGLNSGDCVVGNMGSEQRFDYSVLGDAVNLASRLEGQSKTYGVDIVIGDATRTAAPDFAALELDRIAVKGKSQAVTIFALRGDAAMAASGPFQALAFRHGAMLAAYRGRDWDEAAAAAEDCRALAPELGALYDLYGARIADFRAHPPGPDWDGVYVAPTK